MKRSKKSQGKSIFFIFQVISIYFRIEVKKEISKYSDAQYFVDIIEVLFNQNE